MRRFCTSQLKLAVFQDITAIACLFLAGCATKMTVRKATVTQGRVGIYYALPRTVVMADVVVKREDFAPGIYAGTSYAQQIAFPDDKLKKDKSTNFSIDSASIATRGEPDPEHIYLIDIPSREWLPFRSRSIETTTTETGVLTKASLEVTDTTIETSIATISAIANLAAHIPGVAAAAGEPQAACKDSSQNPLAGRELDACLVFQEIQRLRGFRQNLISGRSGMNTMTADAFDHMLKSLDDEIAGRENRYFKGITTTKKESRTFELFNFAGANDNLELPLLTFSEKSGVCEIKQPGVKPYSLPFSISGDGDKKCDLIYVVLQRQAADFTGSVAPANENRTSGIFYRVPGQFLVKVLQRPVQVGAGTALETEHVRQRTAIAQLGKIVAIPESIAGRNTKYVTTLSSDTGALVNFVLNTKAAFDKDTVNAARDAAIAAADAKTNAVKTETDRTKAETDRLKAEKDLIDARKALDQAKNPPPK